MSKLFKNTAVFSLGLACFIIIAHLVIPHHHDFDTSSSCESTSHCHALNYLVENKLTSLLEFEKKIASIDFPSFEFLPAGISEALSACNYVKNVLFPESTGIPIDSIFPDIISLRAPPSLV